jgi:uncharacterized protein YjbI with pentapeptide repeats
MTKLNRLSVLRRKNRPGRALIEELTDGQRRINERLDAIRHDLDAVMKGKTEPGTLEQSHTDGRKIGLVAQLKIRHKLGEKFARKDFAGVDLSGTNLSGLDLKEINFSGANLEGCEFLQCNCDRTDFSHANLSNTRFQNVDSLKDADMSHADLTGALVSEKMIRQGVHLEGAKMDAGVQQALATQQKKIMEEIIEAYSGVNLSAVLMGRK